MIDFSPVSEGIVSLLTEHCYKNVLYHGQAQAVYHQADGRNRLMALSEQTAARPQKIIGIEDKAQVQLAWQVEALVPTAAKAYGTGGKPVYSATALLLVMSREVEVLGLVLDALHGPHDVQVERVEASTLRVLREYWLVDVGAGKNYDPALLAWAVRCRIGNVKLITDCQ